MEKKCYVCNAKIVLAACVAGFMSAFFMPFHIDSIEISAWSCAVAVTPAKLSQE